MHDTTHLMTTLAVAALLSAGCGNNDRSRTAGVASNTARVRVLHASANAPPVDVYVDGALGVSALEYGQGTETLELPAGVRTFEITATGSTTPVIVAAPNLLAGSSSTVIAVGRLAAIEPLLLADDLTPAAPGQLKLRVVHGHPVAGVVDVYVTAPGADLYSTTPTLANVAFKDASGTLEVPGGTYQVRLTAAATKTVVFDSGPLTLDAGLDLLLVAIESSGGASPLELAVLFDGGSSRILDNGARLRVVHASANAPNVDVFAGPVPATGPLPSLGSLSQIVTNLPFGQAAGYLTVPADLYHTAVTITGSSSPVIATDVELGYATDTTVIALGDVNTIAPLVLRDDTSLPTAGQARLRLVHAASQAPFVDVYVTAPGADLAHATPTVAAFEFGSAADPLEVPAGSYQVRITVAGTLTVAIDTGTLTLAEGTAYTAVALDPAPNGANFSALLLQDR